MNNIDCYLKDICEFCNSEKCHKHCFDKVYFDGVIPKSNIPKRYIHADKIILEPQNSFDENQFRRLDKIEHNIQEFVEKGKCLYIYSPYCGNGKTTSACKLAIAYLYSIETPRELPVKFVNTQSMLSDWKARFTDTFDTTYLYKLVNDLKECDLAIFDDIGITTLTESDVNLLFSIIDYRTANDKSCIFTSNNVPSMLESKLQDDRLVDRILGYSHCIGLSSDNRMRKEK